MEDKVLKELTSAIKGLHLDPPLDARNMLEKNSNGRKWKRRDAKKLKGLVWHQELGWGSIEAVAKYHTGNDSHLYRGGVESIAYTWAIRRDGQLLLCNNFSKAVWSQGYKGRTGDENAEFMSVMFEGLFKGLDVTDPSAGQPNYLQMLSGLILWHVCRDNWKWNDNGLYGHYLFGKPSCPGDTLETIIGSIRFNAEKPSFDLDTVDGRQGALKELGYYKGDIDGLWGPGSKGALITFQEDHNLAADGIWGKRSEAAVISALNNR